MNMLGDFPTATGLSLLHLPSLPNGFGSSQSVVAEFRERDLVIGPCSSKQETRKIFQA